MIVIMMIESPLHTFISFIARMALLYSFLLYAQCRSAQIGYYDYFHFYCEECGWVWVWGVSRSHLFDMNLDSFDADKIYMLRIRWKRMAAAFCTQHLHQWRHLECMLHACVCVSASTKMNKMWYNSDIPIPFSILCVFLLMFKHYMLLMT